MRLPRKRKKEVKKIVARKTATKIAMSSLVTAQSLAQSAIISVVPYIPAYAKTLRIIENVSNTANAIRNIMSEPPNSWKDFIKPIS